MICEVLKTRGITKKWLAAQVHREYNGFHKTLKKHHIDSDLLVRISFVLRHDFFAQISAQNIAQNVQTKL
ncbi:MAG: hypothetical protein LBU90_06780 [Bacteroidales bacterium]|nr:hypothetical protein [Bacteroidales bacterium]